MHPSPGRSWRVRAPRISAWGTPACTTLLWETPALCPSPEPSLVNSEVAAHRKRPPCTQGVGLQSAPIRAVGDLHAAAGNSHREAMGPLLAGSWLLLSSPLSLPTVTNFNAYFIIPFGLSLCLKLLWNALVTVSSNWCSSFYLMWSALSKYIPDNFVYSIHVHTVYTPIFLLTNMDN